MKAGEISDAERVKQNTAVPPTSVRNNRGGIVYKKLILFSSLFLYLTTSSLKAQDKYIQITVPKAEILFAPARTSEVIATARNGDIFRLSGDEAGWYAIYMFSGEERHIPKASASIVAFKASLPQPISRSREIYRALFDVEGKATADADRKYPPRMIQKNIEYQRVLHDRYSLDVMHQFGTQPAISRVLNVAGAKAGWWR